MDERSSRRPLGEQVTALRHDYQGTKGVLSVHLEEYERHEEWARRMHDEMIRQIGVVTGRMEAIEGELYGHRPGDQGRMGKLENTVSRIEASVERVEKFVSQQFNKILLGILVTMIGVGFDFAAHVFELKL